MKSENRAIKALAGLTVFAALTACGSGDAPSSSSNADPQPEQAQTSATEKYATTAPALPSPNSSTPPTLKTIPPAPADGPPTAVPTPNTSRLALASGLGRGLFTPSVLRQVVARGLVSPTDLVLAEDGLMFYTERAKGLYSQRPGQAAVAVFTPHDLNATGAGGMLAVTLDPEFPHKPFVYVFMRASQDRRHSVRVVRLAMDDSRIKVQERRDIMIVPEGEVSQECSGNEAHFGGGMRFGPDGFLYVGIGDCVSPAVAGSPNTPPNLLAGTVLRIDRNGLAAPGNRAPAGYDSRVYAYGMRDPIAVAFHPNTGKPLVAQRRGPRPDDIALINVGANAAGAANCTALGTGNCESPMQTGLSTGWRAERTGEGLSAMERLRDPRWRDWRNAFVVAFEAAQRIDLIKFDAEGRVMVATPALQKLGVGFKAVAQGPDAVYVITSGKAGGEEIWRLSAQ